MVGPLQYWRQRRKSSLKPGTVAKPIVKKAADQRSSSSSSITVPVVVSSDRNQSRNGSHSSASDSSSSAPEKVSTSGTGKSEESTSSQASSMSPGQPQHTKGAHVPLHESFGRALALPPAPPSGAGESTPTGRTPRRRSSINYSTDPMAEDLFEVVSHVKGSTHASPQSVLSKQLCSSDDFQNFFNEASPKSQSTPARCITPVQNLAPDPSQTTNNKDGFANFDHSRVGRDGFFAATATTNAESGSFLSAKLLSTKLEQVDANLTTKTFDTMSISNDFGDFGSETLHGNNNDSSFQAFSNLNFQTLNSPRTPLSKTESLLSKRSKDDSTLYEVASVSPGTLRSKDGTVLSKRSKDDSTLYEVASLSLSGTIPSLSGTIPSQMGDFTDDIIEEIIIENDDMEIVNDEAFLYEEESISDGEYEAFLERERLQQESMRSTDNSGFGENDDDDFSFDEVTVSSGEYNAWVEARASESAVHLTNDSSTMMQVDTGGKKKKKVKRIARKSKKKKKSSSKKTKRKKSKSFESAASSATAESSSTSKHKKLQSPHGKNRKSKRKSSSKRLKEKNDTLQEENITVPESAPLPPPPPPTDPPSSQDRTPRRKSSVVSKSPRSRRSTSHKKMVIKESRPSPPPAPASSVRSLGAIRKQHRRVSSIEGKPASWRSLTVSPTPATPSSVRSLGRVRKHHRRTSSIEGTPASLRSLVSPPPPALASSTRSLGGMRKHHRRTSSIEGTPVSLRSLVSPPPPSLASSTRSLGGMRKHHRRTSSTDRKPPSLRSLGNSPKTLFKGPTQRSNVRKRSNQPTPRGFSSPSVLSGFSGRTLETLSKTDFQPELERCASTISLTVADLYKEDDDSLMRPASFRAPENDYSEPIEPASFRSVPDTLSAKKKKRKVKSPSKSSKNKSKKDKNGGTPVSTSRQKKILSANEDALEASISQLSSILGESSREELRASLQHLSETGLRSISELTQTGDDDLLSVISSDLLSSAASKAKKKLKTPKGGKSDSGVGRKKKKEKSKKKTSAKKDSSKHPTDVVDHPVPPLEDDPEPNDNSASFRILDYIPAAPDLMVSPTKHKPVVTKQTIAAATTDSSKESGHHNKSHRSSRSTLSSPANGRKKRKSHNTTGTSTDSQ